MKKFDIFEMKMTTHSIGIMKMNKMIFFLTKGKQYSFIQIDRIHKNQHH